MGWEGGDRGRKECERPRESVGSRDQRLSVSLSLAGCRSLFARARGQGIDGRACKVR